jgi:hypothetical protein
MRPGSVAGLADPAATARRHGAGDDSMTPSLLIPASDVVQ